MDPIDREPPEDDEVEREPARAQGPSPVIERARDALSTIAAIVGIALVVAFLFVTGGSKGKPESAKKTPVVAANASAGASLPEPPPDTFPSAFEVPNNRQHFGPAPGAAPSHPNETAENARQKAEARLHSPMLIYDASEHGAPDPAASRPNPADVFATALATQIHNASTANAGDSGDANRRDRSSAAESYADRTQAFAKSASDQAVPEATARRVTTFNRVGQGKMVPAILETAIQSDLPGMLRAIVAQDVWSEDGSRRLIRRGSRLTGEYRSGLVRGQTRVFVIWTRLLQPDGTDVAIGSPGTDDLGQAGLTGVVDRHFAERFGAAVLLSLIGSTTTASQGGNTFVVNTSQSFGQVAQDSLQESVNIPPTVFVDQGTPVQVFVARDLVFDRASAERSS